MIYEITIIGGLGLAILSGSAGLIHNAIHKYNNPPSEIVERVIKIEINKVEDGDLGGN